MDGRLAKIVVVAIFVSGMIIGSAVTLLIKKYHSDQQTHNEFSGVTTSLGATTVGISYIDSVDTNVTTGINTLLGKDIGVVYNHGEYSIKVLSESDSSIVLPDSKIKIKDLTIESVADSGKTYTIALGDSVANLVTKLQAAIESNIIEIQAQAKPGMFCIDPFIGCAIDNSGEFDLIAGANLMTYKSFGLGICSTRLVYGISASYNIHDLTRVLENTNVVVSYGKRYDNGDNAGTVGIAVEL
jgi:hypothetical protein